MLSKRELQDLIISWITISIAFAWDLNPYSFFSLLPIYLVVVGTAFVFHELGHKFAALRLGYPAEYRMWTTGLIFALLLAILTNGRWIFAAPGAVYVMGWPNRRDNGLISLAGPLVNLSIAVLSILAIMLFHPVYYILVLLSYVIRVNLFIGFFNMLPFFPLDGSKVILWNPAVYFAVLFVFLSLMSLPWIYV